MIEELQSRHIRFTEREQYLGILNQWADETGDRQIGRNISILAVYVYLDSTGNKTSVRRYKLNNQLSLPLRDDCKAKKDTNVVMHKEIKTKTEPQQYAQTRL